jgi:hypothetical protein
MENYKSSADNHLLYHKFKEYYSHYQLVTLQDIENQLSACNKSIVGVKFKDGCDSEYYVVGVSSDKVVTNKLVRHYEVKRLSDGVIRKIREDLKFEFKLVSEVISWDF